MNGPEPLFLGELDANFGNHPAVLSIWEGSAPQSWSSPVTRHRPVGSDGYVALVTPAEATYGGKGLFISTVEDGVALAQPRLVVDGDIKGGRYVSVMVDLVVGPAGRSSRETGTSVAES